MTHYIELLKAQECKRTAAAEVSQSSLEEGLVERGTDGLHLAAGSDMEEFGLVLSKSRGGDYDEVVQPKVMDPEKYKEDALMEVNKIVIDQLLIPGSDTSEDESSSTASDHKLVYEQPDTPSTPDAWRTSQSLSPVDVSLINDSCFSPLTQGERVLEHWMSAPVSGNFFLGSEESAASKSMYEEMITPVQSLKFDKLSEVEKKNVIVNLVKIQNNGTVEVDLSKDSPVASELLDLGSMKGIPPFDFLMVDREKPVPKLQIAILVVGTRGDVQPFLAIAMRLQEYGHHVRLATHSNFQGFVKSAGIDFYPLGGDPRVLAGCMTRSKGLVPSSAEDLSLQRKQVKIIIESLLPACMEPDPATGNPFRAQAIIANPPAYGHTHLAEALGVPLHIFFTMPWTPTYAFPHPLARVPQSAGYWLSYVLVDLLIWWGIRGIINDFRKKRLKLAPIAYFSTYHGSISHLPTGYMWSPRIVSKPNDWGPLVDVVGYCFLNLGSKYQPSEQFAQWIQKGDKPIYIGFGSMPLDDSLRTTQIILDALEITGQRGIIDRGWGDLGTNSSIPDNVFLIVDCPHDWLFPQCSAVVHHGGAGTTATGLRAGCPTTVVPFFGDQFFWAERVHHKGLGPAPIPISELSVESLSEAIRFMLRPEVKSRAMEVAECIRNEDGVGAAVDAFHRHLPPVLPLPPRASPFLDKDEGSLEWLFARIGRLCCLACGGA